MKKRRKNPYNDILNYISKNSTYLEKYGDGSKSNVYLFETNKNLIINNQVLKKGVYILKVFLDNKYAKLDSNQINYLKMLSKYGLVPKIYIITTNYIIMRYIEGYTLLQISEKYGMSSNEYKIIFKRAIELGEIFYKISGYYHNDLSRKNIIVSKDFKRVFLIDPGFIGLYS